jgi:drug/metabolite transporter (DMT)-like permease
MPKWIARGLTALTVFLWSMSYIWGKAVLTWAEPLSAAFVRFTLASALLLAIVLLKGNMLSAVKENWRAFLVLGGIGLGGCQALQFIGLDYTSSVNGAVIMGLAPLLSMAGGAIFLGEPFGLRGWTGGIVALIGALLAVLGDGPRGISGLTLDRGEPIMLLAALCLAFYTVGSRKLLPSSVSVLHGTTAVIVVATVVLMPFALSEPAPKDPPDVNVMIAIAGLAVGSTVLAFLAWMHVTRVLGVRESSVYCNFIPVITMLLAALHGARTWPAQIVGALLVATGVILSVWRSHNNASHAITHTSPGSTHAAAA